MALKEPEFVGADRLRGMLEGRLPYPSALPYDDEAEVTEALASLEYAMPSEFGIEDHHQHIRARIRYLAALWPDAKQTELAHRIHGLLNNRNISIDDLRLILQAKRLSDPSKSTNEVPIPVIQGIGKCLREGKTLRTTAREMRVSYDTVERIEKYLGIRSAIRMREIDAAVEAVRGGLSIREFSKASGISRTRAQRMLAHGRSVLVELGETV